MEVTCIKKSDKIKNLTVGNEYTVEEENEDYYFVEANNGEVLRYKKSLFEEVRVRPSVADIVAASTVTTHNGNSQITIRMGGGVNLFHVKSTHISCGVFQLFNLQGTAVNLRNKLDDLEDDYSQEELHSFIKLSFAKCISYALENTTAGFLIMSDNILSHLLYDVYREWLDENATIVTEPTRNSNSSNDIKIWIFDKNV